MNDTITLYEKCDHGRLESHVKREYIDIRSKESVVCPGGRERHFKRWDELVDPSKVWVEVDGNE